MRLVKLVGLATLAAAVVTAGAAAFKIAMEPLPIATVGVAYTYTFKPIDGAAPYTYTLIGGSLPSGMSVTSDGRLTGTPTQSGDFVFSINGHESSGRDTQAGFTLTVVQKLTVATPGLGSGTVGTPYSATLTATGGGTLTWSVSAGALPAGLTLAADGTISGTPTAAGPATFTVKVTDGTRVDTKQYTIAVAAPLTAAAPTGPGTPGVVGKPFKATPTATGGVPPYAWSVASGTLPAGLAVDPATGAVSGTPTSAGTFPVTLGVKDAEGRTATVELSLTVARVLALSTTTIRGARVGKAYTATFHATGGVAPQTWKITRGKLPVGFRLSTKTGVLSGTAKKPGAYRFTLQVSDSLGEKSVKSFVLTVRR